MNNLRTLPKLLTSKLSTRLHHVASRGVRAIPKLQYKELNVNVIHIETVQRETPRNKYGSSQLPAGRSVCGASVQPENKGTHGEGNKEMGT